MDPLVNQAEMHAITLYHINFTTGSLAHIDSKGRWTPSQSGRDACHTTTPYKFYYWIYCTYRYQRQMDPPVNQAEMPAIPLSPTTGSIAHIDTKGRWTPQNQAEMPAIQLHHISFTTGSIAHIDTKGRWTPQSIKQRCLPYHFTNYWIYCTYRYQR